MMNRVSDDAVFYLYIGNINIMQKKTTEEFINEARTVHGNKYDYSKSDYTGVFNKLIIICPVHGEFEQTPHNHLKCGCIKCARENLGLLKNKKAKDAFIEKAKEKTNGKYDFSEAHYVNAKTKVKVICHNKDRCGNEHGPFYITPSNLFSLYGCPKCGCESLSLQGRLSLEEYQKSIDEKYGEGLYTVDEESYNSNPYEVKIYCNAHNKYFLVSTRNFPRATVYRCPDCRNDAKLAAKEMSLLRRKELYHKNRVVTTNKLQQPELDEKIKMRILNGEEVWVPVRGHNNYMVSSIGRIKKINRYSRTGKPLPDYICNLSNDRGRRIWLQIDGKSKAVHKIVFESFYNVDIPKGCELTIDHIDTNPLNNSLFNLRLCRGIRDNMVNNPLTMIHMRRESKSKDVSPIFDIDEIEGETWKPCLGYEGLYSVSNLGRVKAEKRVLTEKNTGIVRTKKPHLMRLHLKDERSYTVGLIDSNGKHKNHFVHRLEYEAFVGKIPEGYEIDHIDSNSKNNVLSNLRACTHEENARNPNSIKKRTPPKHSRGVGIVLKDEEGNTIKEFSSMRNCAEYFGVRSDSIRRIVNGAVSRSKVLKNNNKLVRKFDN